MEIKYTSKNCLQLIGKKESILVNPDPGLLKKSTSRVIVYNEPTDLGLLTMDNKVIIVGPGEYEVGGVEVTGISDGDNGVVYSVIVDGLTVAILGNLTKELSDKKMDKVGSADVLVANIGKNDEDKNKQLLKLAKGWGVNYLIPCGYENNDKEIVGFLNVTDNEGLEPISSLKIDKDGLPDGLEVTVLKETA